MSAWDEFGSVVMDFFDDDTLPVTYRQYTEGTYDVNTGTYTPAVVETECKAILLDLTQTYNGASVKFGTLIVSGDKELYLLPPDKLDKYAEPLVINPAADRVLIGLVEYRVVNMKEIAAGVDTLVFDLMLRR